ncbi:ribonuclease P protein component [Ornithinimicrobium pratense]|uniref:Ribonuclease P protein component n=1 Tax=Ornithinimicrobium pratense TaxID=2593973 RepID=A0A5J6V9X5_9MICO|nr:ribonuclease P protein component [Ornithinimicrobium pratense]QFG70046.1 ribonuclease P protein component [Ornithinimicrobium pratense]
MLPRRHRLSRPEDYRGVSRRVDGDTRRRRRAGTDLLVVHAAMFTDTTPTRPPRVGFVVSKAVGNSVVRHRVIRRLRAQVVARLSQVPAGTDLVVRAQPPAATASSHELGAALDLALERVLR